MTPTTDIYTDGAWTIVEIRTDTEHTKRRFRSTDDGDHVENYRHDPEDGWLLHGPSWSPGLHEEWVDGELVSSTNTDAGYRMRTVARQQIVDNLVEDPAHA